MNLFLEALKKTHPYTAEYARRYGYDALASTFEIPPVYKSAEELYRDCLRKGKRWQELVALPPKNVIL